MGCAWRNTGLKTCPLPEHQRVYRALPELAVQHDTHRPLAPQATGAAANDNVSKAVSNRDTRADARRPGLPMGAVLRQAACQWSHKSAPIAPGGTTSFADLDSKVDRLAVALLELGVTQGDRIRVGPRGRLGQFRLNGLGGNASRTGRHRQRPAQRQHDRGRDAARPDGRSSRGGSGRRVSAVGRRDGHYRNQFGDRCRMAGGRPPGDARRATHGGQRTPAPAPAGQATAGAAPPGPWPL